MDLNNNCLKNDASKVDNTEDKIRNILGVVPKSTIQQWIQESKHQNSDTCTDSDIECIVLSKTL